MEYTVLSTIVVYYMSLLMLGAVYMSRAIARITGLTCLIRILLWL